MSLDDAECFPKQQGDRGGEWHIGFCLDMNREYFQGTQANTPTKSFFVCIYGYILTLMVSESDGLKLAKTKIICFFSIWVICKK